MKFLRGERHAICFRVREPALLDHQEVVPVRLEGSLEAGFLGVAGATAAAVGTKRAGWPTQMTNCGSGWRRETRLPTSCSGQFCLVRKKPREL